MNAEIVTKISGPPGTGKTSTLINVVESLLSSGVAPDDILYSTYTRAGSYEARDRACDRFKLSPAQFPYFRTIHSLCYHSLGQVSMMGLKDWFVISTMTGYSFSMHFGVSRDGEPISDWEGRTRKGDRLLYLWNMARMLCMPPEKFIETRDLWGVDDDISWQELEYFIGAVNAYKKDMGKHDFTDLIEQWIESDKTIQAGHIIIDEAQDLSPLMWKCVKKLCQGAKRVWIAGDDDQCIHEWSGSDPKLFIELQARQYTVLPQSHRIPKKVHVLANLLIEQVQTRLPKTYNWKEGEEGSVIHIDSLDSIDMSKGSWMLLARMDVHLRRYEEHCIQKGFLFTGPKIRCFSPETLQAIHAWNDLLAGHKVCASEIKKIYARMSRKDRVKNGFKQTIEKENDGTLLAMVDLTQRYGLVHSFLPWHEAMDMIPRKEAAYLASVERSGGFEQKPRITISTIHGVKGAEADNVVINPDLSDKVYNLFLKRPDPEHRVFYVGVTRAKKSLYILPPTSQRAYPL